MAIGRAAAFGDLSENAEYTSALEERDHLTKRATQLKADLDKAKTITTEMAADEPANAVADSRTMAAEGALDLAPPRAQASLPPTSRPTNVVALPARRDRRSSSAG